MPTDALRAFRDTMLETKEYGFDKLCDAQWELGNRVRDILKAKGIQSVAAEGFGAPGVVVSYTGDPSIQNGSKFAAEGMQIAAGVPLACDEPEGFMTFRLGLFGLDKLYNVDGTVARLKPRFGHCPRLRYSIRNLGPFADCGRPFYFSPKPICISVLRTCGSA